MTAHKGGAHRTFAASDFNVPVHAAFGIAVCAYVALYAKTLGSLAYTWAHNGTYEYAFLIPPLCLVLVWMRRDRLRRTNADLLPKALFLLLGLCLLWLLGAVADVNLVGHFTVIAMIPVLVYCFYGANVTRALAFPLCYLFFAVPFGNFMVGPLQDITAHLSVWALEWTDVPVFMTGRVILTPASGWHVAEACSGVKFFVATTAFGVLYANLFYRSLLRRVVFVAFAMVVPIIANGLRVFFTILIGEYFGVEYATGTDHLIFGWQFFGTVLVLIFLAGWPWHEFDPPADKSSDEKNAGSRPFAIPPGKTGGLALVCLAVLAAAPGWYFYSLTIETASSAAEPDELENVAGLQQSSALARPVDVGARFVNADERTTRYYGASNTVRVDYARYDGATTSGHELITTGNRLYDSSEWRVESGGGTDATGVAAGFAQRVLVRRQGDERRLVWYLYRVNGRASASQLMVKAWQAWYALRAAPVFSSVIVLSANADDLSAARRAMADFASALASRPDGG